MGGDLAHSLVNFSPVLVVMAIYLWVVRSARIRSLEMMRVNNALLEANLEMVTRLRNIEALLEKDRQV
jgi:hypothetical protein